MQRRIIPILLGALLLGTLATVPATSRAQTPPQSSAYGHTLAEWFKIYVTWFFAGGPDTVGKVKLMPIPAGNYVSGAGTPADPSVLVGSQSVTLKTGTPFVLPIALLQGELYQPGTPVAVNPDPPFPASVWNATDIRIVVDGKTIIDSGVEDKFRYFTPAQYFDSPLYYSQPTGYGSIAATFFEGFCFVHPPLSKGKHTMTLESSLIFPGGNLYPNAPDGFGIRFQNTWCITVK